MNEATIKRLEAFAAEGQDLETTTEIQRWAARSYSFIRQALGDEAGVAFNSLSAATWDEELGLKLGHIEGLLAVAQARAGAAQPNSEVSGVPSEIVQSPGPPISHGGKKVFVVHGHDNEAKEGVARFLYKLGLEPIILHEQASAGRTVIEKFETYSHGVAFAVVLLTPDDLGAAAADVSNLRSRARQNVIMELGYFIGKLGRMRVCACTKGLSNSRPTTRVSSIWSWITRERGRQSWLKSWFSRRLRSS